MASALSMECKVSRPHACPLGHRGLAVRDSHSDVLLSRSWHDYPALKRKMLESGCDAFQDLAAAGPTSLACGVAVNRSLNTRSMWMRRTKRHPATAAAGTPATDAVIFEEHQFL